MGVLPQIIVGYSKPFSASLDESLGAVGKNLARKRFQAFAKAVLRHPQLSKSMLLEVANKVRTECANLGSTKNPSLLLRKSRSEITKFGWEHLVSEWEERAPVFFLLLTAACDKQWNRRHQTISPSCIPALCMAGGIVLKTRNKHMSVVQTIISLLLNAGHASSQVSLCYHAFRKSIYVSFTFHRPTPDSTD